jgi:hypothetical protein
MRGVESLGALPDSPWHSDSWAGGDLAAQQAAMDDDVAGNGIFDGPGAPPVQNAGNGVFEARYAEPGYLYRERLGRPSGVLDQTTGEPIIFNPNAGGSWHEDVLRTYRKWDVETPRYYNSQARPHFQSFGQAPAEEDQMKEYAPYAIGGFLAGVAAAMLYKQYKKGELF